jgi:hypothetical protein
MLELKNLTDSELSSFLELFRNCSVASHSRFFLDLFCIVERETLARHTSTELPDYSDRELSDAVQRLTALVDDMRSQGAPDNYPSLRFLLLALNGALDEIERREAGATTH